MSAISAAAGPGPTTTARRRGLREQAVQRGPPQGEQDGVAEHEQDEDGARKRIGLREEVDRRERRELGEERGQEPPQQRLPEAFVLAVEPERPEGEELDGGDDDDVDGVESNAARRQQRDGSGNRDVRPRLERGPEHEDRDGGVSEGRDVAKDGRAAACHASGGARADAGRELPVRRPSETPLSVSPCGSRRRAGRRRARRRRPRRARG